MYIETGTGSNDSKRDLNARRLSVAGLPKAVLAGITVSSILGPKRCQRSDVAPTIRSTRTSARLGACRGQARSYCWRCGFSARDRKWPGTLGGPWATPIRDWIPFSGPGKLIIVAKSMDDLTNDHGPGRDANFTSISGGGSSSRHPHADRGGVLHPLRLAPDGIGCVDPAETRG